MQNKSSIRNLILTIILVLGYQIAGIYLAIFFQPRNNFYIMPILQIVFLMIPVWFLSGKTWEERRDFLKITKIDFDIFIIVNIIIFAISFQLFYNSFAYFQEVIFKGTDFESYLNIRNLKNNSLQRFFIDDSLVNIIYGLVSFAFIPAISEELIFRGFLQNSYLKDGKYKAAIYIPAAIFTLGHFNPMDFIQLFIMAVILGKIVIKNNSINYSIFLHLTINLIAVLSMSIFPESGEKDILEFKSINSAMIYMAVAIGLIYYSLKKIFMMIEPKESEREYQ